MRERSVTGVQTCGRPIGCTSGACVPRMVRSSRAGSLWSSWLDACPSERNPVAPAADDFPHAHLREEPTTSTGSVPTITGSIPTITGALPVLEDSADTDFAQLPSEEELRRT